MSRVIEFWLYVVLAGRYATTEKWFLPPPECLVFGEKGIQGEKWNIFVCLSDSWIMPAME